MSFSQERALSAATLSLLYPGLGQALQGRRLAACWHALEFSALFVAGLVLSDQRGFWWSAAVLVGVYSIADAYRYDRHRTAETPAP